MTPVKSDVLANLYRDKPELQQLRDRMGQIVADTVRRIVQDTSLRVQGEPTCKTLSQGIFYSSVYYELIQKLATTKKSAKKRLDDLIKNNSFWNSHPPAGFELVSRYRVQVKKGTVPSVALKSILEANEFALMDCAMVCQIGQYWALLSILGPQKFDRLFNNETGVPLMLSQYDASENPLMLFLHAITPDTRKKGHRDIAVGQRVCFDNVSGYKTKHLRLGEASSYHVICLNAEESQQTFVGHGLKPTGMTEEEVEQVLVDEYNKLPPSPEMISVLFAAKIGINKRMELARIKLLEDPSEENKKKWVDISTPQIGHHNAEFLGQELQRQAKSAQLTLSDVYDKEFGLNEKNYVLDFRIDLIQHLVKTSLKLISFDAIRRYSTRM